MKVRAILLGVASVALSFGGAWAATGKALIKGTAEGSKISGTVTFEDTADGLKVSAKVENGPAGDHGFHIHEFGDCSDMGKNAGSHYNPRNKPHGHVIKDGLQKAHAGDLGNMGIGEDGKGSVEATIPGITIADGKNTVGGRAVILHEKADDYSQPVGNAGGRIGCGPIVLTGK